MTIGEHARFQLYGRLEEVLGPHEAATLMDHLPPGGSGELARQSDLGILGTELRGEMRELQAELRGEMAELRGEMREFRGEMYAEFGKVRSEMRGQWRSLFLSVFALQLTSAGLMVGVAQLI